MLSYLESLTVRLAEGVGRLPESVRERNAGFFLRSQRDDGGFAGRDDQSDLYYTGFALRALALTGELRGDVAERAAAFLAGRLAGSLPIVDFLSLIYGATLLELSADLDVFAQSPPDWRNAVADALEAFRREDGGYAKGPEGKLSSTYHTFLVVLCNELIGAPIREPERMVQFIHAQRREDGGFIEIKQMRRSGTNPTAAAIGVLKVLNALDEDVRAEAAGFLVEMQDDEGGLKANTRIPIADLLSTFTGLLTLADLGALEEIDTAAAARFAHSLESPQGGFLAAAWDDTIDVEYSFYGLATLALLAREAT